MMRRIFLIVAAVLAAVWQGGVCAPSTADRGLRGLNLSHGLSDLLVNVIFEDSQGYVWLGTESSLDRFDGNRIVRYPIEGDKRQSRRVLAIVEPRPGEIYVGTHQGLYELSEKTGKLKRLFADKIDFSVTSFAVGADGELYIGTEKGLYIYNLKTGKLTSRLLVEDNLSSENEIIGLECEPNGSLYVLTEKKLWSSEAGMKEFKPYTLPTRHQATRITRIGKTIYIGTEGDGVMAFDTATKQFGEAYMPGNGVVTSLSVTGDNDLVVGTDGEGIYYYCPAEGRELKNLRASVNSEQQLRANSVYSVLSKDDGGLWIGYYQSGVDYTPYSEDVLAFYETPRGEKFSGVSVRTFSVDVADGGDMTGVVYGVTGTPEGALLINKHTGEIRRYAKPELASNTIFASEYLNGLFYVGTYHGGMYTINPKTGELRRFGPAETHDATIFKIKTDGKGNLWVGSSEGLYKFEKGKWSHFTSHNSPIPEGNVYEIYFDSTGRGWICTESGLAIWNGTHLQSTGFPTGFINNMKIRTVYEDSEKNLYFVPDRGEIVKSDLALRNFGPLRIGENGRFSQFTSIIEDNEGWLWIGTDKGLVRHDKNDRYFIYNNIDGMVNPVFTLATPIKDENGNIWLGSTSGMVTVDVSKADAFEKDIKGRKLHFTGIFADEDNIKGRLKSGAEMPEITLGNDERDLLVEVSDFSYRYFEYFELEYKMEGLDEEWRWTDGVHPIEYKDLKPGKYTLRVRRAGDPDSEISMRVIKRGETAWLWLILGAIICIVGVTTWVAVALKRKHKRELDLLTQTLKPHEEEGSTPAEGARKSAAYTTTRLTEEECKRLYRRLESVMKTEKPYTDPELNSKRLAEMAGTSAHSLSFLFNQYLKKSYYDYVNEYRVEEFKQMVRDSDVSKYTLTTLAERCGFSSRASFFRHFKSITGQTPAEYLKEQEG
ncbi:MAG: helix-turn-helix domain-containing protein [Muribaculaceae bacterium]|nr:helix-turn-helix domain-containing protein [Muribaculaceae bacterium]